VANQELRATSDERLVHHEFVIRRSTFTVPRS